MTDVLGVSAFQLGDPFPIRVWPEGDDTPLTFTAHEPSRVAV